MLNLLKTILTRYVTSSLTILQIETLHRPTENTAAHDSSIVVCITVVTLA
jgi:hypothetical protein